MDFREHYLHSRQNRKNKIPRPPAGPRKVSDTGGMINRLRAPAICISKRPCNVK